MSVKGRGIHLHITSAKGGCSKAVRCVEDKERRILGFDSLIRSVRSERECNVNSGSDRSKVNVHYIGLLVLIFEDWKDK